MSVSTLLRGCERMDQLADADVARAMYGALDGKHAAAVAVFLDDASMLHVSGDSGLAGDYQGRDAILALLGRMAELTGGTLRCGVSSSVVRPGDTVVLQGPVLAEREGRTLDTVVNVAVTVAGRLLREIWLDHVDQPAFDDFWS